MAFDPAPQPSRLILGQDFALRPANEGDRGFIVDSWAKSYSSPASDFAIAPGDADMYFRAQRSAIELCLGSSEVLVACDPDPEYAASVALGWCCFRRPSTLHYLYVKEDFRPSGIGREGRRGGIGRALFDAAFGTDSEARIYATHVHTLSFTTKLLVRKTRKGADYRHPVPAWFAFGRRVCFWPMGVLA